MLFDCATPSGGSSASQHVEDVRVHDVDRVTRRVGADLIEDIRKLDFVLVPRHVSDVRCAHNVIHSQQRVAGVSQRFVFVNIDGSHAWPARAQSSDKGTRLNQRRPACIDQQSAGFHARQIISGDDPLGLLYQSHVQGDHIACFEERALTLCRRIAIATRTLQRCLARPHQNIHPEGSSVACYRRANPSISVDSQRLVAEAVADPDLPSAGAKREHLLGNLTHGSNDQAPR